MSHSRDGPGVTAPLRTNIVPLTALWNYTPPPLPLAALKSPRICPEQKRINWSRQKCSRKECSSKWPKWSSNSQNEGAFSLNNFLVGTVLGNSQRGGGAKRIVRFFGWETYHKVPLPNPVLEASENGIRLVCARFLYGK